MDIDGVIVKPLVRHADARGWLCELFRADELPAGFDPAMGYVSETTAGVTRGPHEHVEQSDCFCFLGPASFMLYLWDNRPKSPTHGMHCRPVVGRDGPVLVIVPPGVVHAYRNVSAEAGLVLNFPNRLYRGPGRQQPVDEIRHEDDPHSPFAID